MVLQNNIPWRLFGGAAQPRPAGWVCWAWSSGHSRLQHIDPSYWALRTNMRQGKSAAGNRPLSREATEDTMR